MSVTSQGRDGGQARTRLPYLPGLDGLRAVAVLAVLLYHGRDIDSLAPVLRPDGGFLGVEVFFVISGYLITALLVDEFDGSKTIALRSFWIRRARRLLPALFAFLAATVALAALFGSDALDKIRREILGAVFYVSNWLLIATDESYFEAAGRPSLLRHLWSLAIEEQFYLVWPLVVLAGLRFVGRRALTALTVMAALASTVLLWVLFDAVPQYGDVTSVYYRTDARAAALLVGAAAAMIWRPWHNGTDAAMRWALDTLGFAALALVVAMQYVFTDQVIEWASYERLYHGGFLALSASTVIVIAAVASPLSRLGWLLGNPVLRWIGLRSYGLYLWHWPIFQLTRPRVDVDIDGVPLFALRWGLTFALTELSYRFIESPIRERRFRASVLRPLQTPQGIATASAGALALIGATAVIALAIPTIDRSDSNQTTTVEVTQDIAPDTVPALLPETPTALPTAVSTSTPTPTVAPTATRTPTSIQSDAAASDPTPNPVATPTATATVTASVEPTPTEPDALEVGTIADSSFDPDQVVTALPSPTPTQPALPPPPPLSAPFDINASQIHIIGDSVIQGARGQLFRISPRVTVDSREGRQWWEVEGEIRQMRAQGFANDVVIIQLGNNGSFNSQMFDGVMSALNGTRLVLFINVHAPVVWEGDVNKQLAFNVSRYPDQARLVDWYSASVDHPDYFIEDGTHLQGPGMVAFRRLIESALISLS